MLMEFPFPPSVNAYWAFDPGGVRRTPRGGRYYAKPRTYLSDRAERYRGEVATLCALNGWRPALTGRLAVSLTLHNSANRKFDVDNFCKGLFDALTYAGVWADDSQIDVLHIERGEKRRPGAVVVRVEVLSE